MNERREAFPSFPETESHKEGYGKGKNEGMNSAEVGEAKQEMILREQEAAMLHKVISSHQEGGDLTRGSVISYLRRHPRFRRTLVAIILTTSGAFGYKATPSGFKEPAGQHEAYLSEARGETKRYVEGEALTIERGSSIVDTIQQFLERQGVSPDQATDNAWAMADEFARERGFAQGAYSLVFPGDEIQIIPYPDRPGEYKMVNFLSKERSPQPGWLPDKPKDIPSAPAENATPLFNEALTRQEEAIVRLAQEAKEEETRLRGQERITEQNRKAAETMVDEINRGVAAYIKNLGTWAKMGLADDIREHAHLINIAAPERLMSGLEDAGEHLRQILSLYARELPKVRAYDPSVYEREVTRLRELIKKVEEKSNFELRKDPEFS